MLLRTPWLRRALCLFAPIAAAAPVSAQQTVFLDFSQPATLGVDMMDFTQADRDIIQAAVERDFLAFDFTFTQTAPTQGDFSTIRFNTGSNISSVSKVDFRNTDKNDVGFVQTSPEFNSFLINDQFGFPNLIIQQENFLQFTANVASRTVGQLVGLETFDALGPIGAGLNPDQGFLADPSLVTPFPVQPAAPPQRYDVGFQGPENATTTELHLLGSRLGFQVFTVINPVTMLPTDVGIYTEDADKRALVQRDPVDPMSPIDRVSDQHFGPRAAVKLAFNEQGTLQLESDAAKQEVFRPAGNLQIPVQVQPLVLETLDVPTTSATGPLARQVIASEAAAVRGEITTDAGGRDLYSFTASANDIINIEVKSDVLDRFENEVDTVVAVLDSNFQPIDYFGEEAVNDDELVRAISADPNDPLGLIDSLSSRLLDLVIPADGEYFIEVSSFRAVPNIVDDTGTYELFIHNSRAVDALVGDFNVDGVVNTADYALWRDTFDDDVVPFTGADADGNGKIDVNDYDEWLANVGQSIDLTSLAGLPLVVGVPEPTTASLALLAALAGSASRRRD